MGVLTLGAMGLATSGAYAAPGGVEACPSNSVCLYYNSPNLGWGSFENWSPGQSFNLAYYKFGHWGNGSGAGQSVLNNAASIVNNTGHTVYVRDSFGTTYSYGSGYADSLYAAANHDSWLIT
ncbi:peptidase inhibitor family I36 protein [Streptomyces sp. cg36]|uniref:peptidase inhibitor family I36 protein n=1 Tax=Streptomyces sp. cg36 TaxID=3238798 RepID=UPI0034E1B62D